MGRREFRGDEPNYNGSTKIDYVCSLRALFKLFYMLGFMNISPKNMFTCLYTQSNPKP
jgi:hypothetical protein